MFYAFGWFTFLALFFVSTYCADKLWDNPRWIAWFSIWGISLFIVTMWVNDLSLKMYY